MSWRQGSEARFVPAGYAAATQRRCHSIATKTTSLLGDNVTLCSHALLPLVFLHPRHKNNNGRPIPAGVQSPFRGCNEYRLSG